MFDRWLDIYLRESLEEVPKTSTDKGLSDDSEREMSDYLNDLYTDVSTIGEGKVSSMSRVTRQAKVKRAIGSLATNEARKKNDMSYQKMIYFKELYKKYKKMLMLKYSARVRSRAMR